PVRARPSSIHRSPTMTSSFSSQTSSEDNEAAQAPAPRIAIVDADSLFVDAVTPRLTSLGMHVQADPRAVDSPAWASPDIVLVDADGEAEGAAEWVTHLI